MVKPTNIQKAIAKKIIASQGEYPNPIPIGTYYILNTDSRKKGEEEKEFKLYQVIAKKASVKRLICSQVKVSYPLNKKLHELTAIPAAQKMYISEENFFTISENGIQRILILEKDIIKSLKLDVEPVKTVFKGY